ncbi:MAG: aminotransferase class V-fold PLP-dependent enzyme [Gammaproteobacteria bacterium]|nr:aminotransferase class V-fold PLP-dependent enzyme [Gammaproteobacteria bacterium]
MTSNSADLVYLDYAATTPVDPRVARCMFEHMTLDGDFANPSSVHRAGLRARDSVEAARSAVAEAIRARVQEIIWTSGATESTNLALQGVAAAGGKQHIVTCSTEHPATLDVCAALARRGVETTYLRPNANGHLDPQQVADTLEPHTSVVTLMHVNNELGVVHDIASIGEITRQRGVLLHVDAAQSLGKIPIDVEAMHIDLLSCTAHKVYGPKGIGVLYVRSNPPVAIVPLAHGGGQERGLRPGTLPTQQIVGMGEAVRIAMHELDSDDRHIRALREQLWRELQALEGVYCNNPDEPCVAGILSVSFDGLSAEDLLLEAADIAMSAGSACASGSQHASHVLQAIGLSEQRAHGTLRLSLGRFTTGAEIERATAELARVAERLRENGGQHTYFT